MKWTLITLALFSNFAMAANDFTLFNCTAGTNSGKEIRIWGCIKDSKGTYDFVACPGENFEFVTIERYTSVAKMTPDMVETAKIPGRLFSAEWLEDGFTLKLDDPIAGKIDLEVVAGEELDKLDINTPSMKHSFKAVSCSFN